MPNIPHNQYKMSYTGILTCEYVYGFITSWWFFMQCILYRIENALRFKLFTKLYGSLSTFTWDLKIIFTLLNENLRGCRKGPSLRNLYVTFTQLYKPKTLCNFNLHDSVKLRKGFPWALRDFTVWIKAP